MASSLAKLHYYIIVILINYVISSNLVKIIMKWLQNICGFYNAVCFSYVQHRCSNWSIEFCLPERCIVATVVMMPGITDQTQWGLLNKLQAHYSASAAELHGIKSTSWMERQSRINKAFKKKKTVIIPQRELECFTHYVAQIQNSMLPLQILTCLKSACEHCPHKVSPLFISLLGHCQCIC